MQEDDVFEPLEIQDQAIGNITQTTGSNTANKTYNTQVYTPVSNVDEKFPTRIFSHETISNSLNTMTKKIMGAYTFAKNGAIKIGEYVAGVSGEVNITPSGITGKDANGDTTFSIDATTGDATFKGDLMAGSVITGAIEVGSPASGYVRIDGANNRIIVNDGTTNRIVIGEV